MSKPIPNRLLIHSATLKHLTGLDRDRNPTYTSVNIAHVRIEVTKAIAAGSNGIQTADTMTLYIDVVNSVFTDTAGEITTAVIPAEDDVITWNNGDYTVAAVHPCYTMSSDAVHHYEVTLK